MNTPASRLRQARIAAGFRSARTAAIHFGWPISTYAAHENGQNALRADVVQEYAQAFKTDITWLAFGFEEIGSYIPIIGMIKSQNKVDQYPSLITQDKFGKIFNASKLSCIAKTHFQFGAESPASYGFVAYEANSILKTEKKDLVITIEENNSPIQNETIIFETENEEISFGISLYLDAVLGKKFNFQGDMMIADLTLSRDIRIKRVWKIAMIVKKDFWQELHADHASWSYALQRIKSARFDPT